MRAAAVLLLTLGGSAFVYQGEEIGMIDGPRPARRSTATAATDADDRCSGSALRRAASAAAGRGSPPVDPGARNVDDQRADPGSLLNLFRELIAMRREIDGEPRRLEAPTGVLAFDRGEAIGSRSTSATRAATVPAPAGAELRLATADGAARPVAGGLELDGHSGAIIRLP